MTEVTLYHALERMVNAAERADYKEIGTANTEFSKLLKEEFGHFPNWSMDETVLRYDRCANSAIYSFGEGREEHLQRMRDRFSKIPKPA